MSAVRRALLALVLSAGLAGAQALAPNELGRVMILEYHKVAEPENRWTRTPAATRMSPGRWPLPPTG